jgi:hypothetical protein
MMSKFATPTPESAADWYERNVGRTVTHDGEQGVVTGYSREDGHCWLAVDVDDGSTAEWLAEDVSEAP